MILSHLPIKQYHASSLVMLSWNTYFNWNICTFPFEKFLVTLASHILTGFVLTSLKIEFLKIMTPIGINSAIKFCTYFSISLACFVFVSWQSVQCIQKYIEKPQGTKLTLQHISEIPQFPAITICNGYDEDHLKKCGLRYDNTFSL